MAATVRAFPAARRASRVTQASDHMDKMTRRQDRAFNSRFLLPLAKELAAAGVPKEEVARELEAFHRAVVDEVLRRTAVRYDTFEGDAA